MTEPVHTPTAKSQQLALEPDSEASLPAQSGVDAWPPPPWPSAWPTADLPPPKWLPEELYNAALWESS